jgi:hypothetical protein
MAVWWATEVECVSAVARLERERLLRAPAVAAALERLDELRDGWQEVEPTDGLRRTARRLLRLHALRSADALQLAAAVAAAEENPAALEIVTLDERLAEAARREGFVVVEP